MINIINLKFIIDIFAKKNIVNIYIKKFALNAKIIQAKNLAKSITKCY